MIAPKKIVTDDETINRVQDNTTEAFNRLQSEIPLLKGVFKTVDVATTATTISHGLGRRPIGYLVCDKDANANIWTSSTTPSRPEAQINLQASSAVKAKIYFF